MSSRGWSQLAIVHLSDLHFGAPHRFQPEIAPDGRPGSALGYPTLSDSVLSDAVRRLAELHESGDDRQTATLTGLNGLRSASKPLRTIFALTGDLTETAALDEFRKAGELIASICASSSFTPALEADDVFVVPGNHDVVFDRDESFDRWSHFCDFYRQHSSKRKIGHVGAIDAHAPHRLTRIIDQSADGLVVAEINSASHVRKGALEALRGEVDIESLERLRIELEAIDQAALRKSIKIALIHHHPIVLPTLAEARRGYDAVMNAAPMLGLLKRFGFQLILHGHKHDAQTFPHDSVSAWSGSGSQPMMVVSGGSVGSVALPDVGKNTYNIISVKWHPGSAQARVRIETRGLELYGADRDRLLPPQWHWTQLRVDDRLLRSSRAPGVGAARLRTRDERDEEFEEARQKELAHVRRCFPVVEVVPSLATDQGFEARVWIEGQLTKKDYVPPVRVEWNAGPYFKHIAEVTAEEDPSFSASFSYYGPTSIQVRMYWADGHCAVSYIFAHFPGSRSQVPAK